MMLNVAFWSVFQNPVTINLYMYLHHVSTYSMNLCAVQIMKTLNGKHMSHAC